MYLASYSFFVLWILLTLAEMKKIRRQGHDPGECNEKCRGNFTIIQDRQGKDKLLFCMKRNDGYIWTTTDGSNSIGEYFNPAYDCTDILNKNENAKDGYYYIKLSGSSAIKVYCDQTSDGGGFMLIGRKNSSVTLTVPSSNKPVEPFGEPHWSSSLGQVPILDFRVQVATREDFEATKTDWFFRLQKTRLLKNLLITNEGGCITPGIGDVASVKDLQTAKVVTTSFRCSHFGIDYPKYSPVGWNMMNYCLDNPCRYGFAFHHKYQIQNDFSGAFSYSASANASGFSHDSTSFVGCENQRCCACFGPPGGKKNYCGNKCTAKNGGTIAKNVYTWFWVRSSLPKRLWKKCMEYKVTTTQGRVVWYKLYNGNAVPVMGRCSQNEPLVNNGIVVVPDSTVAQKIPAVQGLLEYRKDNQKLYVRVNETWKVIGEENEVVEKTLEQVNSKIEQSEKKILGKTFKKINSEIELSEKKVLEKILKQVNSTIEQSEKNVMGKTLRKINSTIEQSEKKLKTEIAELEESVAELKSQLASVNRIVHQINDKMEGKSCATLHKSGERKSGIYMIDPDGFGPFQVWCDMTTAGGGWTVFQRRQNGRTRFYRYWRNYKNGFGDLNSEFWLGLDKIHRLSKAGQNVLRVDLMDFRYSRAYAQYVKFTVASESDSYRLNVGSFSGNAGDSLSYQNGMKFTTRDRKNDRDSTNCAVQWQGAWWYNKCHKSNLNGRYYSSKVNTPKGISWYYWKNNFQSMKRAEMKMRPSQF